MNHIVSKFDDRQPLYHLEKQFETRADFSFPRQTMARTVIDCATPFNHKNFVNDWFAGFKRILHRDADLFFELLFEQVAVSPNHCNAHVRRKFEPIARVV